MVEGGWWMRVGTDDGKVQNSDRFSLVRFDD